MKNSTILIIITALTLHSLLYFLAAGRDDTFIMLWSGQNFTPSEWFINYNHDHTEMVSSELAAWIASLTRGLPTTEALLVIKAIGALFFSATLAIIWKNRASFAGSTTYPYLSAGLVLYATGTSTSFAYWCLGGLETAYYATFLTWMTFSLARDLGNRNLAAAEYSESKKVRADILHRQNRLDISLAVILSALVLTRTEGFWPIFAAWIIKKTNQGHHRQRINHYWPLLPPLATFIGLITIRQICTGHYWPSPTYAKVGLSMETLTAGAGYIKNYFTASPWCFIQFLALCETLYTLTCRFARSKSLPNEPQLHLSYAGLVICGGQIGFTLLSGGNWMEYSRFMAPIVPALNIITMESIMRLLNKLSGQPQRLTRHAAALGAATLSTTQVIYWENQEIKDCSTIIPPASLLKLQAIATHTIDGNCSHSRDMTHLKPFIDQKLLEIVNANPKPLIAASYQGGLFPYLLRQRFNPGEIHFVDTTGVTDTTIGTLPGTRSTRGVKRGGRIDLALMGKAGELSEYLHQPDSKPDLVYLLGATNEVRENFKSLGYEVIWDQPGAIIFYRQRNKILSD
ncbi:hypothetical protein [Methyloparacoccus murrellii]